MLTTEQMKLVAEGMFPGYEMTGLREICDKSGSKAVVVRVCLNGSSKRVLFFGTEAPVGVTTPQRDWLVCLASRKPMAVAVKEIQRPYEHKARRKEKRVDEAKWLDTRLFGTVDTDVSALLIAKRANEGGADGTC